LKWDQPLKSCLVVKKVVVLIYNVRILIISFTPTKWEIYNHNQQSSRKRMTSTTQCSSSWGYYGGLVTNNGII
jgi:hypothetical protein